MHKNILSVGMVKKFLVIQFSLMLWTTPSLTMSPGICAYANCERQQHISGVNEEAGTCGSGECFLQSIKHQLKIHGTSSRSDGHHTDMLWNGVWMTLKMVQRLKKVWLYS